MPVYHFSTTDPGALFELADKIEQYCRGDDHVEVKLAGRGYAGYLRTWQAEEERLQCKMLTRPRIKVSRNHDSSDHHELVTEREVYPMDSNLLGKCIARFKMLTNSGVAVDPKGPETKDAPSDNLLLRAIGDQLAEECQNIRSLKNATIYIARLVIIPVTDDGRTFIETNRKYGNFLEEGVLEYVRRDSAGHWPLIKPSASISVEICEQDTSMDSSHSSDFLIIPDWSVAVQGAGSSGKAADSRKKTLPHPLKITVESGGSSVTKTITQVPCRINRLPEGSAEISLADCNYVSGTHLVLDQVNDELVVADLGSKHGSFVDGKDLRQSVGSKKAIKPGTRTIVDLCLGNNLQQVEKNSRSTDRKTFPRLIIEYSAPAARTGTPELQSGTPELDAATNW